jgi:diguanylate cyclase (GGDEF)-like protein
MRAVTAYPAYKYTGIDMDITVEFLSSVEIFSLLNSEEIGSIAGLFTVREIKGGEVLFREGDEGNELFIVKRGTVASSIRLPDGSERQVALFNAGNFFGEMSIFENAPRSATCYCTEQSTLLGLHEKEFYRMIEEYPDIATKIMYRMLNITTQRLRDTGEFLSDMVHWGEAARKRAITDELTGAYNRRFLDDAMMSQLELARNSGASLSLMMVDLDNFRDINEQYGHETGDRSIVEVVKVINRVLRESDILARFGGDEFVILMPDTTGETALEMAERTRLDVETKGILKGYGGRESGLTLSIGIASFPEDGDDVKRLKEAADQALYRAKESGRNRVMRAG